MNPLYLEKRVKELTREVEELKARLTALEAKPKLGRPPKHETDRPEAA